MSLWNMVKKNIVPIVASPFTAGASLAFLKDNKGNTVIDHVTGAASAREQNRRQQNLQEKTNAQSIELANTAHQREIQDLQAAGLNPVLSAGGSGAATPSLGTAQVQNEMPGGYLAQAQGAVGIIGGLAQAQNAISTANQANTQANLNNVNAQIQPELAKAKIASDFANAGSAKATADYTKTMKDVDKALKESETKSNEWENKINKDLGTSKNDSGFYRAFKNSARSLFDKTYNPLKNTIE